MKKMLDQILVELNDVKVRVNELLAENKALKEEFDILFAEHQKLLGELQAMRAVAKPEQEPVAWGIIASNTGRICQVELDADEVEGHNPKHIVPLYTTPPQRTWVGLTDDEIDSINYTSAHMLAKEVEAKLKEKNT